jgi:trans-aconitate 2-methyltransferase
MSEWDAEQYSQRSGLQAAMAAQVLALLKLNGTERVLDVGCGDGRTTADIAARVPRGSVVGVDASHNMIALASKRFSPEVHPNLRFQIADARTLPFREEFDLVVSFNALHWIPEQDIALRSIHSALKPGGVAQLRLVPAGERKSIETVLEETRLSSEWSRYFSGFHDPYLRLTPEQYAAAAQHNGFRVDRIHTQLRAWDFETRASFLGFSSATMVEWTSRLPEPDKLRFINEVLDRYQSVAADRPGEENTFKFYQMDLTLTRN